jgi:hypothetical protein
MYLSELGEYFVTHDCTLVDDVNIFLACDQLNIIMNTYM